MNEDNVINRVDEKSHKNTIYTTAVMTPVLLALYGIERKTDSNNTPKQRIGILAVSVVTGICAIVYLLAKMQP